MSNRPMLIGGAVACVALAGCAGLATFAANNFLRLSCRSKESEAKTNLAGLVTAEKAFYGENGVYSSDLVAIGWEPDGAPGYVYGFAHPGPGLTDAEIREKKLENYDETLRETSDPRVVAAAAAAQRKYETGKMKTDEGVPITGADLPPEASVSRDAFRAGASGDISSDNVGLDVWTIDEKKQLTHVTDDCRGWPFSDG